MICICRYLQKFCLWVVPGFAAMLVVGTVSAQDAGKYDGYYRQPLDGRLLLSANFAETRTDHFHSGIDVKTGGVEGKPLYAAADGYICRVGALPTGFGRVLYINHPNNTTTVYAHMQKFIPEIEAYVASERYRLKRHRVDLYPSADMFPVKKGQLIGYSGNSGSSMGPHLHFEIRDTPSQKIMNVPALGVYDIRDDIPPTIVRLHYIEMDTVNGVPVSYPPVPVDVMNVSKGEYILSDTSVVEVGENGYFVLEATDRKNDTHNTMGIYRTVMSIDGDIVFSYKIDNYLFSEQRYVNSLAHYGMQKGSRNELLRLAVQENNKLPFYSDVRNRGAVCLADGDVHRVDISAWDDSGNVSTVSLRVRRRRSGEKPPVPAKLLEGMPVYCNKSFARNENGAYVAIPAGALYEPIFYTQNIDSSPERSPDGRKLYSPVHAIHREDVPLHKAIDVSIDVSGVPAGFESKLCLARVSADGTKYTYAGGKYEKGRMVCSVRNFGKYCVTADNKPPTVTPSFKDGENLSSKSSVSFTLRDDFAGVASFNAAIDGKWIAFEQQGAVITHYFDPSRITYNGGEHELSITVTDNVGNSTTLKRKFIK